MNHRKLFFLVLTSLLAGSWILESHAQRGAILDRNGCILANNTKPDNREYPWGALAAHTLGYTNLTDEGKQVGRHGIEKQYESELARNREVTLTIDVALQLIVEDAMRKVGRGAAVVIDPNSGEILASVSVPSFDPNQFSPRITSENWKRYIDDPSKPLFDRTTYPSPPGSVFKLVTALSGGKTGAYKKRFHCGGGCQYGKKFMKCWKPAPGHGTPDLSEAIKHSCNGYFYRYGNDTRIENIVETGEALGLGVFNQNQSARADSFTGMGKNAGPELVQCVYRDDFDWAGVCHVDTCSNGDGWGIDW